MSEIKNREKGNVRWISVREALPDDEEKVLVKLKNGKLAVCVYSYSNYHQDHNFYLDSQNNICWSRAGVEAWSKIGDLLGE